MLLKFCSMWSIPRVLFCIMICDSVHLNKPYPEASELGKAAIEVGKKKEYLTCNSSSSTAPLRVKLSNETVPVNVTPNISGVDVKEREESRADHDNKKRIVVTFQDINDIKEKQLKFFVTYSAFLFHLQVSLFVFERSSQRTVVAVYLGFLLFAFVGIPPTLLEKLPMHLALWYSVPSLSNLSLLISCGWLVLMIYPTLYFRGMSMNHIKFSGGRIVVKNIKRNFILSVLLGLLVALCTFFIVDRRFVETSFGFGRVKISLGSALCFQYPIYIFYACIGIGCYGVILGSALRDCIFVKDRNDLRSLTIYCKLIIFPTLLLIICANWYSGCEIMTRKHPDLWILFVGPCTIICTSLFTTVFILFNYSRKICVEIANPDVLGANITSQMQDECSVEQGIAETISNPKQEEDT